MSNSSCGFGLSSTDDFLHRGERLLVSPGKGIMSTILTLNYSDRCCSGCLRTMLWIKHKDQVRIRRKPQTSAKSPLCCGSTCACAAPPKAPTKLLRTSPHVEHNWLIWISKQELILNRMTQTQRVKVFVENVSGWALSSGMKDSGQRFLWDGEDGHVLLTRRSCAVSTPCNRLYFLFPGS